MVPKQSIMVNNNEEDEDGGRVTGLDGAEPHDRVPSESPARAARRSSTTSGGMSDAGMQASQTSVASDGGMQRRTRPRQLDYGMEESI